MFRLPTFVTQGPWRATRALLYAGALVFIAAPTLAQRGEGYRYRNAEGREVITNAGNVTVDGAPPSVVQTLPELMRLDLGSASPAQLQQLDRGISTAHDALQNGDRCEAIRASSRVRTGTILWRQHLRALCTIVFLVAVALVAFAGWSGRLRALMPAAPLLGALYLGYASYAQIEQRASVLREGLRACSSDLPHPQGATPEGVKARLESALTLQATIDQAYMRRDLAAESALRERY
ncbi:MAG: hypothetical protein ABW252_20820 [Polyangiales bacterium]